MTQRHWKHAYRALWALVFLVAACTNPLLTTPDTAKGQAANALAKAEDALTIANRYVEIEAPRGVWTREELMQVLRQLDEIGRKLSMAHDAYRNGLFDGSLREALASKALLEPLQAFLAARIRKERSQ